MNSPNSKEIFLISDHKQPGKKIRVSKLLLQISIFELHNDLISKSRIYQLKYPIDEITGNPLISDTALCALMPKMFEKLHTSTNRCVDAKYVLLFAP